MNMRGARDAFDGDRPTAPSLRIGSPMAAAGDVLSRGIANVPRVLLALTCIIHGQSLGAQGSPQRSGAVEAADDTAFRAVLPDPLRVALLDASPVLAARRAGLAAAIARGAALGFSAPATLNAEIEDVPGARVADGSMRLEVGREFLSSARRTAERSFGAAEVRIATVGLEAAARQVLAVGARSYIAAIGWRGIMARLAGQDSLLASAEVSLRARFAAGQARYVDVLRLRTERLRVQTDRAQALTEARAGLITLEALLGGDSVRMAQVAPRVTALRAGGFSGADASILRTALPPAPALEDLVALAGDVRLASAQVDVATAMRGLALARQRPSYAGTVGLQRLSADAGGTRYGPIAAFGMTLPFTAGAANRAARLAADAEVAASVATRTAVTTTTRGAVAAARARYESDRERLASYDAALLLAAREERASALAAYRTGDLSLLELVDFERALAQAEIGRLRALLDGYAALADLLSGAAGGDRGASPSLVPSSAEAAGTISGREP